jgi:hypothetical protein
MFKLIKAIWKGFWGSRKKSDVVFTAGGTHDPAAGPSLDKNSTNYDPDAWLKQRTEAYFRAKRRNNRKI